MLKISLYFSYGFSPSSLNSKLEYKLISNALLSKIKQIFATYFERPTCKCKSLIKSNTFALSVRPNIALLYLGRCPRLWKTLGFSFDIIGCGSAIKASFIAFALHDNSARLRWIHNFSIKYFSTFTYSKLVLPRKCFTWMQIWFLFEGA